MSNNERQLEEAHPVPVDALYVNFAEESIRFLTDDMTVALLRFAGLSRLRPYFETLPSHLLTFLAAEDAARAPEQGMLSRELEEAEKDQTTQLSGRLKSVPKPGKLDRSGNPTLWARAAMHREGHTDPLLVLATFHGHTATIAQRLKVDAPFTAQGYLHLRETAEPNRLPTYSVFHLLEYPGKPASDSAPQAHTRRR